MGFLLNLYCSFNSLNRHKLVEFIEFWSSELEIEYNCAVYKYETSKREIYGTLDSFNRGAKMKNVEYFFFYNTKIEKVLNSSNMLFGFESLNGTPNYIALYADHIDYEKCYEKIFNFIHQTHTKFDLQYGYGFSCENSYIAESHSTGANFFKVNYFNEHDRVSTWKSEFANSHIDKMRSLYPLNILNKEILKQKINSTTIESFIKENSDFGYFSEENGYLIWEVKNKHLDEIGNLFLKNNIFGYYA